MQGVVATCEQRLVLGSGAAPVRRRVRLVPDDDRRRIRNLRESTTAHSCRTVRCARGVVGRVAREPEHGEHDACLARRILGAVELVEPRSSWPPFPVPRHPETDGLRAERALPTNDREWVAGPLERVVGDADEQVRLVRRGGGAQDDDRRDDARDDEDRSRRSVAARCEASQRLHQHAPAGREDGPQVEADGAIGDPLEIVRELLRHRRLVAAPHLCEPGEPGPDDQPLPVRRQLARELLEEDRADRAAARPGSCRRAARSGTAGSRRAASPSTTCRSP